MRVLSGIQPSGSLHLGNFFGMMKNGRASGKGRSVLLYCQLSCHDQRQRRQGSG